MSDKHVSHGSTRSNDDCIHSVLTKPVPAAALQKMIDLAIRRKNEASQTKAEAATELTQGGGMTQQ